MDEVDEVDETPPRGASWRRGAGAVALLALLVVGFALMHALRESRPDPIAPSAPVEVVERTLRLAGLDAAAEAQPGTATVDVDASRLGSVADAEIAYQTAFAALASTWPRTDAYVVRLARDGFVLAEVKADGASVREAVVADDATALVALLEPRLRAVACEQTANDTPAFDASYARYLDAKNRAAGLLGQEGPEGEHAERLIETVEAMRRDAPGVRAPRRGETAFDLHVTRIEAALAAAGDRLAGAQEVRRWLDSLGTDPTREEVALVRQAAAVAEALVGGPPLGSLLADTAEIAQQAAFTRIGPSAYAEAVRAAARDPRAPSSALEIASFERVPELDASPVSPQVTLATRVLERHGTAAVPSALAWDDPDAGPSVVAPDVWPAYRRADGALYWRAGDGGPVALTDHSVRGWAFAADIAALVDAADVERVLAVYPVE